MVNNMKVLNDDLMTAMEYHRYILSECERQWKECQEEKYGPWDSQSDDEKADYYNSLYSKTGLLKNYLQMLFQMN